MRAYKYILICALICGVLSLIFLLIYKPLAELFGILAAMFFIGWLLGIILKL